jgi:phosphate-selective porin OprO/OprP
VALVPVAAAALAVPAPSGADSAAGWDDGFFIASDDGDYRIHFTSLVQVDARFFLNDSDGIHIDQFYLRRLDLGVTGTVHRVFDYRLRVAAAGGRARALDAWLELKLARSARLRVGKLIPPVGLELAQSNAATLFAERGLQSNLVPVLDVGLMLSGDVGVASYALAVLDGAPDGAIVEGDTFDGKTVVARVFATPFARGGFSLLHRLGVHGAVSYGDERGSAAGSELPVYRTAGQEVFFSYVRGETGGALDVTRSAIADGPHVRWVAGVSFYRGALGVLGEWGRSEQRVRLDAVRDDAHHTGWNVSASWTLTGEEASFQGIVPKDRFDPARGTWGAVELAVRVNGFSTARSVFESGLAEAHRSARRAFAMGAGVNWWLSRQVRITLDYEETRFDGGAGTFAIVRDRATERVLLGRVQMSL